MQIKDVRYIIVWIGNFLIWLFLPLILLFLRTPIKKLWLRVVLCLISPIMLLVYPELYDSWERKHRYDNHNEISEMIGFHFPSYDVVGYEETKVMNHIRQGYDIKKTVRFDKPQKATFYAFIDSLCYEPETGWETEQYAKTYAGLVKEYVDKWGEDSLYLYVNKWDSIAKEEARKFTKQNDIFMYYGHYINLQMQNNSDYAIIKYCDYH